MNEADNWLAYIRGEAEYQYREHWHNCVWNQHTPLLTIIDYGWGAGFYPEQTLHECIASGYSECVASPLITKRWKWQDEYDVDIETVVALASMLGRNEDFDGLISALEDYND